MMMLLASGFGISAVAAGMLSWPFREGTSSKRTAWTLVVLVPLLSASIYLQVGHPGAIGPALAEADARVSVVDVVELQARIRSRPDDAGAWQALAHAHEAARDFPAAVLAYRSLVRLKPDDVAVLSDFAVALAVATESDPTQEPIDVLQRALTLEPDNVQTLALLGSLRYARRDYAGAVSAWEPIQDRVDPASPVASMIAGNIEQARVLAQRSR